MNKKSKAFSRGMNDWIRGKRIIDNPYWKGDGDDYSRNNEAYEWNQGFGEQADKAFLKLVRKHPKILSDT